MKTYIHTQTPGGRSLGFSAQMENPYRGDSGRTMVFLSLTFCNSKDKHFNKKVARAALAEKEARAVRVVDLPRLLAEAEADAVGVCNEHWFELVDALTPDYNYVLRRFV